MRRVSEMFSGIDARRLLSAFEARGITLRADGDRLVACNSDIGIEADAL